MVGGDGDKEDVGALRERNLNSRLGFFLLPPAFSAAAAAVNALDSSDG